MGFDFNGTDQFVYWPSSVEGPPGTIALWFKPDLTNAANDYLWWQGQSNEAGAEGLWLSTRGTGDTVGFGINASGGTVWADTTNTFTAGAWHHVVGINAGLASRTCVLNGDWASRGTNTSSRGWTAAENRSSIGAQADDNPSNFFPGGIAEVAMWDTALEQGEVEALASGLSPLRIAINSLQVYRPLMADFADRMTQLSATTS